MLTTVWQTQWVQRWRQENGGHNKSPKHHALKALEELLELCFATGATMHYINVVLYEEQKKAWYKKEITVTYDPKRVREELADVTLCIEVCSLEYGVNVMDAVDEKIPTLEER